MPTSSLTATPSSRARSLSYSLSNGAGDRARRLGTLGFGGDELGPHNLLGFVEVLLRDAAAGEQIAQLRFQLDHLLGHRLGELHDLQQLVLE